VNLLAVVEVTRSGSTEETNRLLSEGWTLFAVVSGGGEHIHYILTREEE
jgi:hypothetical protein